MLSNHFIKTNDYSTATIKIIFTDTKNQIRENTLSHMYQRTKLTPKISLTDWKTQFESIGLYLDC